MKFNSLLYLIASTLVSFLLSSSAGGQSFQRSIYTSPTGPIDVFAADLNHDGKTDLITGQSLFGESVTVFLNNWSGTFSSATYLAGIPAITRLVASDFSGNGTVDIDAEGCTSGGPTIAVLSPDGSSGFVLTRDFGVEIPPVEPFANSCMGAIALITLAKVTVPSIIISASDPHLDLLENDGTGLLLQQENVFGVPGTTLSGAVAGDFNGDHLQDIAAISTEADGHTEHIVVFFQ